MKPNTHFCQNCHILDRGWSSCCVMMGVMKEKAQGITEEVV